MKTKEKLMSEVYNCLAREFFHRWLDISLTATRGVGIPLQRCNFDAWEIQLERERLLGRPLNKMNHRLQLLRLEHGFDDTVFKCRHRTARSIRSNGRVVESSESNKVRVDLQDFKKLIDEMRRINEVELDQLEIWDNGEHVSIPKEVLSRWPYIGLNNTCYLKTMIAAEHFLFEDEEELND